MAPPYMQVVIQTKGGHQVILDDTPGTGGITLRTTTGQTVVLSGTGAEISAGAGGSVKLTASPAAVNDDTPPLPICCLAAAAQVQRPGGAAAVMAGTVPGRYPAGHPGALAGS